MDMSEGFVVAISTIVGFVLGCALGWKMRKDQSPAKSLDEDPMVVVAENPPMRS
jgi:hypothetical protein